MPNIIDILARALSLRQETALNSITPNRAGGIMYDTLLVLNQMQLEGGALLISKVYASVSAMEADTTPTSDLTGRALKPGQLVVIVTSDSSSSDMGSEYRFNGPGSWTYVGKVGGLPLDTVPTQSSTKGITSGGVYTALAAMKAEGYKYMGLATPGSGGTAPGTPNQPVFYIAGPGSYPNFGSITVASGYLGFIKYSSGSWSVESVAVGKDYDAQISALDGQISQLEAKVTDIDEKMPITGKNITGTISRASTNPGYEKYIKQNGTVASYSGYMISNPITLKAGDRFVSSARAGSTQIFAKYLGDYSTFSPISGYFVGGNATYPIDWIADEDCQVVVCGETNSLGEYNITSQEYDYCASLGATILGWILAESFTASSITRDSSGAVSSAVIAWPDGKAGTISITRNGFGSATSVVAVYDETTYTMTINRDSENNVTSYSIA